jgi:hypothetical protein
MMFDVEVSCPAPPDEVRMVKMILFLAAGKRKYKL